MWNQLIPKSRSKLISQQPGFCWRITHTRASFVQADSFKTSTESFKHVDSIERLLSLSGEGAEAGRRLLVGSEEGGGDRIAHLLSSNTHGESLDSLQR